MNKIDVKLHVVSVESHLCQIYTGFLMLQNQGLINLSINYSVLENLPCEAICLANINGIKVAYDAMDGYYGYKQLDTFLSSVDYYFKRSYSEKENMKYKNKEKISPLGLFYRVNFQGNPTLPKKVYRKTF